MSIQPPFPHPVYDERVNEGVHAFVLRHDPYGPPTCNVLAPGSAFSAPLPRLRAVDGETWSVGLTLEREGMVTPRTCALDPDLHERLTQVLYRALACDPDCLPTFETFTQARRAGIRLHPAKPRLPLWRPPAAQVAFNPGRDGTGGRKFADVCPDAVLHDPSPYSTPAAESLYQALKTAGIERTFFSPHPACDGYDWYRNLPKVQSAAAWIRTEEVTADYLSRHLEGADGPHVTRDVHFRIAVRKTGSAALRHLRVSAPVLLVHDPDSRNFRNYRWIFARGQAVCPRTLTEMTVRAFFTPEQGRPGTPHDQYLDFVRLAAVAAQEALGKSNPLIADLVGHDVDQVLAWLRKHGQGCTIDFQETSTSVRLTA